MSTRLTWTRLANGDLLCVEHPIRLQKPMDRRADTPGWMILVPTEDEPDAGGDGWWWRPVWVPGETSPLEAGTERDARALVVEYLDHVGQWTPIEYPAWTGAQRALVIEGAERREAEWQQQKAQMDATFEASRPARDAARAATKPKAPSPAQVRKMLAEALDLLDRARPEAVSDLGKQTWLQRRDALRDQAQQIGVNP